MIRLAAAPTAFLVALTVTSFIGAMPYREVATIPAPDGPILLMTLNAQVFLTAEDGVRSNLPALLALIREHRSDVIAIQESDANNVLGANQNGVLWLARKLRYYYHYGAPGRTYATGTALLSRWPLDDVKWRLLPATASVPRAAVSARVLRPSASFRVVAGHLQWAEEYLPGEPTADYFRDQTSQAEALIALASVDGPVVVMGDFNAGPGYPGPAYDMFAAQFADAWTEAGNSPTDPMGFTWPASTPTMRIDFIWLSRGSWTTTAGATLAVGSTSVSDHRAVVAEVHLRPAGGETTGN